MTRFAILMPLALLAACAATDDTAHPQSAPAPINPAPPPAYPGETTKILSKADADRLLHNKGLTLQWIDWNTRGTAAVSSRDGLWSLRGAQSASAGQGRLFLDGVILEIGEGYFTFRGRIRITDTPDPGRQCEADKTWHFAVTQNRPYYRLREFEWCDDLTDYIDVYF